MTEVVTGRELLRPRFWMADPFEHMVDRYHGDVERTASYARCSASHDAIASELARS